MTNEDYLPEEAVAIVNMPKRCGECTLYRPGDVSGRCSIAAVGFVGANRKPITCPLIPLKKTERSDGEKG